MKGASLFILVAVALFAAPLAGPVLEPAVTPQEGSLLLASDSAASESFESIIYQAKLHRIQERMDELEPFITAFSRAEL